MAWVAFQRRPFVGQPAVMDAETAETAGAAEAAEVVLPGASPDAGTAADTASAASAESGTSAQLSRVVGAYVVVIVAALVFANLVYVEVTGGGSLQGEALLAVGLFTAQGLERFLEPFARWAGAVPKKTAEAAGATSGTDRNELEGARARAFAAAADAAAVGATTTRQKCQTAADAQAAVDQFRANASVVLWAAGCVGGLWLAALLDLRLISATGANVSATWDIAISGIAIGSATKPLHDLIGALKASKTKTDGAPAGTSGT